MQRNKLTPKQQAFINFYTDFSNKTTYGNATESAVQANYQAKNRKTFESIGLENLGKQGIINAIAEIEADRRCRREYNQEIAARELDNFISRCRSNKDRTNEMAALREKNTIYALRTENIHQSGAGLSVNIASPEPQKEPKEDFPKLANTG